MICNVSSGTLTATVLYMFTGLHKAPRTIVLLYQGSYVFMSVYMSVCLFVFQHITKYLFCRNDVMSGVFFRLNPRFEFTEIQQTTSNDYMIYKSPSVSVDPLPSDPCHSIDSGAEITSNLLRRRDSQMFRKFASEPSLVSNPCRSTCGFRERLERDCLEEVPTKFRRNTSESHANSGLHRMCTKKKSCRKHGHCHERHARLKSRPKFRRPLSDCDAQLNSLSLKNEAVAEPTTSSLSEEEIQSVCADVFLER